VARAEAHDWVKVKSEGKAISRPSRENTLYLLKLPTKVYKHRKELEQQAVHALTKQKANEGVEYIPDGREAAVTVEHF
jgi:hypothetical protein